MKAIVLAAGKGTRMRSEIPKVLHEILGRPMLGYVLDVLSAVGVKEPVVIVGSGGDQVCSFLKSDCALKKRRFSTALQREQKGTGHAVMMAKQVFAETREDVLIWPGDMPLLQVDTLERFMQEHRRTGAAVSVLSSLLPDPVGYGRILRSGGSFYAIREELDASESEKRVQEVNTGIYLFRADLLTSAIKKLKPSNAKQEYYLTDTIEILCREGHKIEAFPFAGAYEGKGINSKLDLSEAVRIMNKREIQKHMSQGVTIVSPDQTYIEPGVVIGADTIIYPWTYIETKVKIGSGCKIGPFAKIRSGSAVDDGAAIGSFVEVVRSHIGKRVNAKHLSYLGDAIVGDDTNIGAGTITANYDGKNKHKTRIGKNVLVGSDTVFVAPVVVEDDVRTGAGTVVTGGSRVRKGQIIVGVPHRLIQTKNLKKRKS